MNSNRNEPIILGELKKEKSSKPFFAFFIFALVLTTCFGLPYIQDYLANGEGPIVDYYNKLIGKEVSSDIQTPTTTTTKTITDKSLVLLKKDTILNIDNVFLQDLGITKNNISFKMMSKSLINLDSLFYYLEIYDNEQTLLSRIKLDGNIGKTSITKSVKTNFNLANEYYVKIVNAENENLNDLNVDVLVCQNGVNSYTYSFTNGELTTVKEEYTKNDKNDIASAKEKSEIIKKIENSTSDVIENDNGYIFTATLDLSRLNLEELGSYLNYNYYNYGVKSKLIKFDMTTKGYDCK